MANPASRRLLVVMKFFSEGYGGTPESVLLLARNLLPIGIVCDVITPAGLFRDIHALPGLPRRAAAGLPRDQLDIGAYAALFVAGPWIWQALGLCRRARKAGIPISYAAKGGLARAEFLRPRDFKKIPYFLAVESLLFWMARRVIFSSPAERDTCMAPPFLWRGKCAVVPEPFEPKPPVSREIRPAKNGSAPLVLGFMAEIAPRKGLRELVEGFARLRATVPYHVTLRIAGEARPGSDAYLAAIRTFANEKRLAPHIEWLGAVRSDVGRGAFYDGIDIFLCPSTFESFGLTPLEALWQGVPVAMGPMIGCRSYLPDDAPVTIFPDINADAIAQTLAGLLPRLEAQAAGARAWRGRRLPCLSGETLARDFGDVLLGLDS